MIIENQGKKFYVPDEIGNDTNLSVADVFASAIPYDRYLLETELAEKNNELQTILDEPDEILVPNENKSKIPLLEEEINNINLQLEQL